MYRTHYGDHSAEFVLGDVHVVDGRAMPEIRMSIAHFSSN